MVQKSQYQSALNIKKKPQNSECSLASELYDDSFCPTVRKGMSLPESETRKRWCLGGVKRLINGVKLWGEQLKVSKNLHLLFLLERKLEKNVKTLSQLELQKRVLSNSLGVF